MNLNLFHASDLHFCEKHLKHVDRAFAFAVDEAIARKCDMAVLSGDSFDASVSLHEPAVNAFFSQVRRLADHMPICVLQGTYSHDRPGSLSPLRHIGGHYPVLVADRIGQAAWDGQHWIQSKGAKFDQIPDGPLALLNLLPSINKGAVAAAVGAEAAAEAAGEAVFQLCRGWASTNEAARQAGIPTIMVTHGTVNGSVTECATALISQDHEFTAGALFAAQTSVVLIGHIHAAQEFRDGRRVIAYPGSITKLIYGHKGQVGCLFWNINAHGADYEHVATPSREMIEIDFEGSPDMERLAALAADAPDGAYVRIRWAIDEEFRASVDKAAMLALFPTAEDVKLEGRVLPVSRQRCAGIGQAVSTADKLRRWGELTDTDTGPLLERLALLEAGQPAQEEAA